MASNDHVAAALEAFAKDLKRSCPSEFDGTTVFSAQMDIGRQHIKQLAAEVEALVSNPRTATYQGFEHILKQAQQLGAQIDGETIIGVASAFLQRPHFESDT
jgi:uncharacterized protein YigA (DUF484 family)